ncbi:MAG: hypothetical protein GY865_05310 [candidate division Zixibacteria bacterium]|nr:hypothetical protein [candidate division Zixibacteria bacterium]
MKVVFGCYVHEFRQDHCNNLIEEVSKRGHEAILAEEGKVYDADFMIQVDQIYPKAANKGILMNHGLVNFPQNGFHYQDGYKKDVEAHSDMIFVPSKEWLDFYSIYEKPMFVAGYPKLDKLFNNLTPDPATVVFAPTHHCKEDVHCNWDVDEIKKVCNDHGFKFIHRGHPAFCENDTSLDDLLQRATIVISDYSSVGLEALALRIPTILIGNERWRKNNHISHLASINAGQRVYDWDEFNEALDLVKDPKFNMKARIVWSNKLCKYKGTSAKRMVDLMEGFCD